MPHVGCVADLAQLTITRNVDTGVQLLGDNVGHSVVQCRAEGLLIERLTAVLREEHVEELRRSRHATDVRRQDATRHAAIASTASDASWSPITGANLKP